MVAGKAVSMKGGRQPHEGLPCAMTLVPPLRVSLADPPRCAPPFLRDVRENVAEHSAERKMESSMVGPEPVYRGRAFIREGGVWRQQT